MNFRMAGFLIALLVGVASWVLTCAAWQFDQVAEGVRPLDPRQFERFTVVTLGTAGMAEDHNRRGTSIAAGQGADVVLVDAGRGLAEALRAATVPVSQPNTLLVTALLPENLVGLDDWLSAAWLAGRQEPIRIVGPPGIGEIAQAAAQVVSRGVTARAEALGLPAPSPRFEVVEAEDGWEGSEGALSFTAIGLDGGPVPSLAWQLRAGDRRAVVGGVGWGLEALEEAARGAHLLVHDAARVPTPEEATDLGIDLDPELLEREAALLTEYREVGSLARRAEVPVLALVRLRPPPVLDLQVTLEIADHYDGRVIIAEDGDEFTP
ncbi:MAG: hypothetical protein AAF430_11325 [Myxococcota bacterium]